MPVHTRRAFLLMWLEDGSIDEHQFLLAWDTDSVRPRGIDSPMALDIIEEMEMSKCDD